MYKLLICSAVALMLMAISGCGEEVRNYGIFNITKAVERNEAHPSVNNSYSDYSEEELSDSSSCQLAMN